MCFYRRAIFTECMHSIWGLKVADCETEKSFNSGETNVECEWKLSHGFHGTKVSGLCEACHLKRRNTDRVFADLKTGIAALRKDLEKRLKSGSELLGELSADNNKTAKEDEEQRRDGASSQASSHAGSAMTDVSITLHYVPTPLPPFRTAPPIAFTLFETASQLTKRVKTSTSNDKTENICAAIPRWRARHYLPVTVEETS